MKFNSSKALGVSLANLFLSLILVSSLATANDRGRDNRPNNGPVDISNRLTAQNITCPGADGKPMGFNHDQVEFWKHNTKNSFQSRAHVKGKISCLYSDRNGHVHFQLTIEGSEKSFPLEIIYNEDFGVLPDLDTDWNVEACGDYITSIAQAGPYPASPDGAILHWVHKNPSFRGHASGFLIIQGKLYGYDLTNVKPRFE